MNRQQLIAEIRRKKSFLCIGLDTDPERLPTHLRDVDDGVLTFNKAIVDATKDTCVAYKINTAFYEALGLDGWRILHETMAYIPSTHLIIADAKRGDIGNTSKMYAKAFFEQMNADAITVAPYMGRDSVEPFLSYDDRWIIILGLTSNVGSADFQHMRNDQGGKLYEQVLKKSAQWGTIYNTMYVVGATHPEAFQSIRKIIPNHFLLVPGVGAQGGSISAVCEHGMNQDVGLLINSSRKIIYASSDADFADAAAGQAKAYADEMASCLG